MDETHQSRQMTQSQQIFTDTDNAIVSLLEELVPYGTKLTDALAAGTAYVLGVMVLEPPTVLVDSVLVSSAKVGNAKVELDSPSSSESVVETADRDSLLG
ncbi:MAG: hypothetical protein Q9213_008440 [Squamulea squamosa]